MKISLITACFPILLILATSPCPADDVRVVGDRVVAADEVVTGDVIMVTGDLVVRGHITGSAIAYVGNITLDSSAVVDGDVIARRGRIFRSSGASVSGNTVEGKLPGVEVGPDSVVGAGSVVTKTVPPRMVAAGNPARLIKTLDEYIEGYRQRMVSIEATDRSALRRELTTQLWGHEA